jgi:hypothetical protein
MLTAVWDWFWYSKTQPELEVHVREMELKYTRNNHFKEQLRNITGGWDVKDVPKDLMKQITEQCCSQPLKDRDTLTESTIKNIMHKRGYTKYHPYTFSIIKHLGGPVLTLTEEESQKLITKFEEFSNAYDEIIGKSFIAYRYILCKLCDSCNITIPLRVRNAMEPNLRKLIHYETVCKQVFDHLGWKFSAWIV